MRRGRQWYHRQQKGGGSTYSLWWFTFITYNSFKAIKDYTTLSYKDIKIGLDLEYKTGSAQQFLSRFNRCKPNDSEKFYDYYKRLIVLARKCNRDDDDSMLAHISQHYPDNELREKCMLPTQTMKAILEWAISRDLNLKENQPESTKSN